MKPTQVGIDPGRFGAVVALKDGGGCLWVQKGNTGDLEVLGRLHSLLAGQAGPLHVAIERNHPVPGMGAVSAFTFGRNYGRLEAALTLGGFKPTVVSAQSWRRWSLDGRVPKDRKGREAATVAAAMKRWPEVEWPKARRWREAVACALFIALYASVKGGK